MRSVRSWYFILCGVLDGFSVILATIPAPFVEGPVQVIVAQSVILFNMLFSYLYIGARYRWSHYLGTAFILTGVLIGSIPEFHGHENTKFYWILILLVATVPAALSNTAKELGLKEHDLDVW